MRLAEHFIFFTMSLINSIIQDSFYHMTDYFEISFLAYKSDYFVIAAHHCYGRRNISRKSVVAYRY